MRTAEQSNNHSADDAGQDACDDRQAGRVRNAEAQRQGNKKDHDASKDIATDGWGGTGGRNTGVHKWIAGDGRGTIQRICKGRIAWSNEHMGGRHYAMVSGFADRAHSNHGRMQGEGDCPTEMTTPAQRTVTEVWFHRSAKLANDPSLVRAILRVVAVSGRSS
jgi:hypothetical protein